MDFEKIGLEGEIDAHKLLRITSVAQELGLRVIDLSQEATDDVPEMTAGQETAESIRWPLSRDEFKKFAYANIELTDDERLNRAKLGVISKAWAGFVHTSRAENDPSFDDPKVIKAELGVAPPSFKHMVHRTTHKQAVRGVSESYERVDEDKTDGLDLDQTGRFLIAVATKLQTINPDEFKSPTIRESMNRILPVHSWAGYNLLCEYIIQKENIDMLEDIDIDSLKQARDYFGELTAKFNPSVQLKKQTVIK